MALIKTPGGEFYLDNTQFQVDYDENSVTFIGEGGDTGPADITAEGGVSEADALLQGTENLEITVPDAGESATIGLTPESVTISHNENSEADGSIRVASGAVELKADTTTVQINGTGVNFGGGALSNISSIGSTASGTAIGFEEVVDMNNHKITNLADPTNEQDAMTKAYADSTYATLTGVADFVTVDDIPAASTSAAGLVRQAAAVPDATGTTDTVLTTTVNNLLAALRTAGILASN